MKYQVLHSRRARYGGMTVSLTVVLIAAVVLLNVMFSTLAYHFSWFVDMTADKLYTVSDHTLSLLTDAIDEENAQRASEGQEPLQAEILFCSDFNQFEKGSIESYIYNTAHELELAFPDTITLDWFDCWLDKKLADSLGVTNSTDVVLRVKDGESRVFKQKEFFVFSVESSSTPIGYGGERAFATSLVSLMNGDRPLACLTVNHDEIFYDYQLLYLLRDAGYNYLMLDLYYEDIPEECELLVINNPNADLIVADGISEISEVEKLNAFTERGGDLMVFMEANTPVLQNLEAFLADWGVGLLRDFDEETERYYNCMVKDSSVALTSDGFTILGDYVTDSAAASVTAPMREADYVPRVVFRDATALTVAQGYTQSGAHDYVSGDRTRSDLFVATASAQAYANGATLSTEGALPLMSVTRDASSGAAVMTCTSVQFATEAYMQSVVFGNNDAMLYLLEDMGKEDILMGLKFKPFSTTTITSITTAQMRNWTLALTLTPAVIIVTVAIFVLVRRKYA